jgi:hypothetical protein
MWEHRTFGRDRLQDDILESLTRVDARSNTSTVALRVVGGDKKGSLQSETGKYGRESHGTRVREGQQQ